MSRGLLLLAAFGVAALALRPRSSGPGSSGETLPKGLPWPVPRSAVTRVGQSVMHDRDEHQAGTQPHKGLDIFVPAGTEVRAVADGKIVRVVDGRESTSESRRRAGLWVDQAGADGELLYRFLHLGDAVVKAGQQVRRGDLIGHVAPPGTSGLGESGPHLHFEVRREPKLAYGDPVNPRTMLEA